MAFQTGGEIKQGFQTGGEIVSTPGDPDPEESQRLESIKQGNIRDQEIFNEARGFLSPDVKLGLKTLRAADTFGLLETVNRAGIFKDRLKRSQALSELGRRGVPKEFIKTFTEIDDATGFIAGLKSEGPEIAGGIIGGTVGAIAGRGDPVVQRRASAIGAGLGAGAGELAKELFERRFRPERGRTFGDLTKDVAFTAATESIGDFVGAKVLEPVLGAIARPFAGSVVPGAPQISKELGEAGRQAVGLPSDPLLGTKLPIQTGISRPLGAVGLSRKVSAELTPEQQSASRFLSFIEGVTQDAFFGGGKLSKTKDIAQAAALPRFIANNVDDISRKLDVLSLDEVGVIVQDSLHGSKIPGKQARGSSGIFKTMQRSLFGNVRNKIPGQIDISRAQAIAQRILKEAEPGGKRLGLPEGTKGALQKLVATSGQKNIDDLIFVRSDIGDLVRAAELAGEGKAKQVLDGPMRELTNIMNRAAKKAGGFNELQVAMKFSAEGKQRLQSNLIRKLAVSKTPSNKVVRAIFGAPGDETLAPLSVVRNVKDALLNIKGATPEEVVNNKFAWDQLRFRWLESNIARASKGGVKKFGKSFDDILTNFGDDALSTMFSKAELEGIRKIALGGKLVGKKARTVVRLVPLFDKH